jgi:hypothetical protein
MMIIHYSEINTLETDYRKETILTVFCFVLKAHFVKKKYDLYICVHVVSGLYIFVE